MREDGLIPFDEFRVDGDRKFANEALRTWVIEKVTTDLQDFRPCRRMVQNFLYVVDKPRLQLRTNLFRQFNVLCKPLSFRFPANRLKIMVAAIEVNSRWKRLPAPTQ